MYALLQSAPELAKLIGEEVEDPEKDFATANRLDTPRLYEEELTEEEELKLELEEVKRERAVLIQSIAHIKTDFAATAGGEAQQEQIVQLEKELELKKLKLNELRTECKRHEVRSVDVLTSIRDAKLLTPAGYENELSTIKGLHSDMKRLEDDLIEAEAKNRCARPRGRGVSRKTRAPVAHRWWVALCLSAAKRCCSWRLVHWCMM